VDLTPTALRNRIERGVVYAPERARRAMENFFTETNLTALREIAMRHAAHEAEDKLRPAAALPLSGRHERILICLTGSPSSAILIRRGKRMADYMQADCIAVHVSGAGGREREAVERHMNFARNLRIDTHVVEGPDIATAIAGFARSQRITQIFMGRPGPRPLLKRLRESVVQQVVRLARDKQITIVAQRG
jgi:two-component system sensor histidine kinase KdpD